MRIRALERAIPIGAHCLLDSSVVLSYLSGAETISEVAAHVVDEWLAKGRNTAAVSVITAMEASIRPMRSKDQPALQLVMDFLRRFPNLRLVPVDANCAFEAARVRAVTDLPAPDALVVACGLLQNVQTIVTNDFAWKAKIRSLSEQTRVVCLSDFAIRSDA